MTAPTPNAELAYRVLDQIDAHPEQWNQAVWIERSDDCGTVACLAGWTVLLAGDEPAFVPDEPEACEVLVGDDTVQIKQRAAGLLGIPYSLDAFYGHPLFSQHNTREDLGRLVAEIFGPRPLTVPPVDEDTMDLAIQAVAADLAVPASSATGVGCRCDWLGEGTPEHAPSPLCRSLRPDADREMQPPPCADHETSELGCPVCTAQRRAFYTALGRSDGAS